MPRSRTRPIDAPAAPVTSFRPAGSAVSDCTRVPALLSSPDYCGTLAAARELGRRGVRVRTTSPSSGSPTAASRYVAEHWRAPRSFDEGVEAQVAGLIEAGNRDPGMVLYPTNDNVAWLQARYASALRPYFRLYGPDAAALESVLDKRRLYEACAALGIAHPISHFAERWEDVERVASEARFPLLLKQRTQIYSDTQTKGAIVHRAQDLVPAYREFMRRNHHPAVLKEHMPFASWPTMQAFHADAHRRSYLVSGFVDRMHRAVAARAAYKILQYPRTLGIALCMESAPLDPEVMEQIRLLCAATGYFGVFQVEYLIAGEKKLLIDFNPRYYHYMAFDIARGLALPWYVQMGACGQETALRAALASPAHARDREERAFCYRRQLNELLWAQRLTGRMSGADTRRWYAWHRAQRSSMVDAVDDPDDPRPSRADAADKLSRRLRHPRAFIRQVAFDRS